MLIVKKPAPEPEVAEERANTTKAKCKRKIFSLKLREEFLNKITNEGKNINEQIFNELFNYQYPSFFVKDFKKNQN